MQCTCASLERDIFCKKNYSRELIRQENIEPVVNKKKTESSINGFLN